MLSKSNFGDGRRAYSYTRVRKRRTHDGRDRAQTRPLLSQVWRAHVDLANSHKHYCIFCEIQASKKEAGARDYLFVAT